MRNEYEQGKLKATQEKVEKSKFILLPHSFTVSLSPHSSLLSSDHDSKHFPQ